METLSEQKVDAGHTGTQGSQVMVGMPPGLNAPKRSHRMRWVAAISIILVITGATLAVAFLMHNRRIDSPVTTGPTDFEKRLNPEQLKSLHAFSLPVYIPNDLPVQKAIIGTSKELGLEYVSFGSNLQYGQGALKGTYGFTEYTVTSVFDPPSDCGVPGGFSASSPIVCRPYAQADKNLPAYVYDGLSPGAVVSTSNQNKPRITMYARRGNEVIAIETIDTDPAELYRIIKSMVKIQPAELPQDSSISFR